MNVMSFLQLIMPSHCKLCLLFDLLKHTHSYHITRLIYSVTVWGILLLTMLLSG